MTKRVACCFSGQARVCPSRLESFRRNILVPLHDAGYVAHTFVHFWVNLGKPGRRKAAAGWDTDAVKDYLPHFIEAINPVKAQLDQSFDSSYEFELKDLPHPDAWVYNSQYRSVKYAHQLCRDYEVSQAFKYDFVVRVRPDLRFLSLLDVEALETQEDRIWIPGSTAHSNGIRSWDQSQIVNDQFGVGPSDYMYTYSRLLNYLVENQAAGWMSEEADNTKLFSLERLLWLYLRDEKIPFGQMPVKISFG